MCMHVSASAHVCTHVFVHVRMCVHAHTGLSLPSPHASQSHRNAALLSLGAEVPGITSPQTFSSVRCGPKEA